MQPHSPLPDDCTGVEAVAVIGTVAVSTQTPPLHTALLLQYSDPNTTAAHSSTPLDPPTTPPHKTTKMGCCPRQHLAPRRGLLLLHKICPSSSQPINPHGAQKPATATQYPHLLLLVHAALPSPHHTAITYVQVQQGFTPRPRLWTVTRVQQVVPTTKPHGQVMTAWQSNQHSH